MSKRISHSVTPRAAEGIRRLQEGNLRFAQKSETGSTTYFREGLAKGQSPFAIILCCSDSRAPAEILFDQGLGDLFVIRVAGNIVAPSLVGSVEFAAATFGTELVVVMGHSNCGAIQATLDVIEKNSDLESENIQAIVERIRPGIEELARSNKSREDLMAHAVRANVRTSANHLRHGSRVLERLIAEKRLAVVGAEFSLETGLVDFFDFPGSGA